MDSNPLNHRLTSLPRLLVLLATQEQRENILWDSPHGAAFVRAHQKGQSGSSTDFPRRSCVESVRYSIRPSLTMQWHFRSPATEYSDGVNVGLSSLLFHCQPFLPSVIPCAVLQAGQKNISPPLVLRSLWPMADIARSYHNIVLSEYSEFSFFL